MNGQITSLTKDRIKEEKGYVLERGKQDEFSFEVLNLKVILIKTRV